jgi:sucrose-6-phosphate hydrolase SacC (GH32 family)
MDYNNTSGLGNDSTPAMVAIYATAHIEDNNLGRQAISIASSLDNGTTFTKYNEGAPVIDLNVSDLRDPNVKWDSEAQHWRLSAVLAESFQVIFFSSPDLKNWTELSRYGPGEATTAGVWECPDLFSLPDPSNPGQNLSVLIVSVNPGGIAGGSGTWYLVGDYTNGTFTPGNRTLSGQGVETWLDYGADNYAGLTFTDAPDAVQFSGWSNNWWQGLFSSH